MPWTRTVNGCTYTVKGASQDALSISDAEALEAFFDLLEDDDAAHRLQTAYEAEYRREAARAANAS
jgi:hypothetical protein